MTILVLLVYVVFPGFIAASSILAVAALIYLPPTGERCEYGAWMSALAAWALVARDRVGWTVRILRDGNVWSALKVTTWTTLTMLFIACGATAGVATAWRKRDWVGHFVLLLVSIALLRGRSFASRWYVWASLSRQCRLAALLSCST